MAIIHPVPHQARYIPAVTDFTAPLAAGQYNFNQPGNTDVPVIDLQPNIVYYLDNFSFGGIMSQETFLEVISTIPQVIFKRRNDAQNIYTFPVRLLLFQAAQAATVFIASNKMNDALTVTMTGILNQNADLIGIDPVHLILSYNIYAIDEKEYNKVFRDKLSPSYANRLDL